jgi:hypothetical protein
MTGLNTLFGPVCDTHNFLSTDVFHSPNPIIMPMSNPTSKVSSALCYFCYVSTCAPCDMAPCVLLRHRWRFPIKCSAVH